MANIIFAHVIVDLTFLKLSSISSSWYHDLEDVLLEEA